MSRFIQVPSRISKFELFRRHGLSEQQSRVVDLIRHGFSNKEISEALKVTDGFIQRTLKITLQILGLRHRKELVRLWRSGET